MATLNTREVISRGTSTAANQPRDDAAFEVLVVVVVVELELELNNIEGSESLS